MKTIIGNRLIITALFLFSSVLCANTVSLSCRAIDGGVLEQAEVGRPFLLEVSVKNAVSLSDQPVWKEMTGVILRNGGFRSTVVNGIAQTLYQFRARIDQPGTYTLGPATVSGDASNTISVTVGEKECVRADRRGQKKQDDQHFLRLMVHPIKAVVGQRLKGELRFYAASPGNVNIIEPERSECSGIALSAMQGPQMGSETIDGTQYQYAQWTFDVRPEKAGTCVVPAFSAEYTPHVPLFSLFNPFGFGSAAASSKKVYSNGARINVVALPASAQDIAIIGTITQFEASLDRNQAHVGDGLILQVSVTGDVDWETIKAPALTGIPAGITWYESKQSVEADRANPLHQKKIFEYIVQPKQPGTFTIPALSLRYYDIDEQAVRTRKTRPITFAAIGSSVASANTNTVSGTELSMSEEKTDFAPEKAEKLSALAADIDQDRALPFIPLPWFFFAIIVILGFSCAALLQVYWSSYQTQMQKTGSRLFATAHRQIKQAQKKDEIAKLYPIFIHLFSSYSGIAENKISDQMIEKILRERKIDDPVISQWNQFFEQLAEGAYFQSQGASHSAQLWSQAYSWLALFKENL